MAQKDKANRLTIPIYIWDCLNFSEKSIMFFYVSTFLNPKRVEIMNKFDSSREFLGKNKLDPKHRVILPGNIDVFLGANENSKYFFSIKEGKLFLFIDN